MFRSQKRACAHYTIWLISCTPAQTQIKSLIPTDTSDHWSHNVLFSPALLLTWGFQLHITVPYRLVCITIRRGTLNPPWLTIETYTHSPNMWPPVFHLWPLMYTSCKSQLDDGWAGRDRELVVSYGRQDPSLTSPMLNSVIVYKSQKPQATKRVTLKITDEPQKQVFNVSWTQLQNCFTRCKTRIDITCPTLQNCNTSCNTNNHHDSAYISVVAKRAYVGILHGLSIVPICSQTPAFVAFVATLAY